MAAAHGRAIRRRAGRASSVSLGGVDVDGRAADGKRRATRPRAWPRSPRFAAALLQRQRDFARPPGLVADGRDMGTVVFPDATLKVFLTASAEERAMRRHKQLKEKGIDVSLPDLSWDIAQRDARDANRRSRRSSRHRMRRVIDSTSLTPEEVIASILKLARGVRALTRSELRVRDGRMPARSLESTHSEQDAGRRLYGRNHELNRLPNCSKRVLPTRRSSRERSSPASSSA